MRLEAQLSLAKRAEFDLAPLVPLQPARSSGDGSGRDFASPVFRKDKAQTAQAAEQAKSLDGLSEPKLSVQLRIEFDQLASRFVYRQFAPPDLKQVAQYPSESQLAFSRALNTVLRAVHRAQIDLLA